MQQLSEQTHINLEIIIADGGSSDGTVPLARDLGYRVLEAPRGRAAQMNAGAAAASHPWLLFLHADSGLRGPEQLSQAVQQVRNLGDHAAGHFSLQFVDTPRPKPFAYTLLEAKTATNREYTINGDQGLLLHRQFFYDLGRFDEADSFLEDQRIVAKIRENGAIFTLNSSIETSARRFEKEGFSARYTLMAIIMGLYVVGFRPFFQAAPKLYQAQGDTTRLPLHRFIGLMGYQFRQLSLPRLVRTAWGIGGFIRQNLWQGPFMLDTRLQLTSLPFTRAYDRTLGGLLGTRLGRLLSNLPIAIVASIWVFAILGPWYWWKERH